MTHSTILGEYMLSNMLDWSDFAFIKIDYLMCQLKSYEIRGTVKNIIVKNMADFWQNMKVDKGLN